MSGYFDYLEAVEDDSRYSYQFDMTGGSAKGVYYTPVGSNYDVQDIVQDIIGYTRTFNSPGTQAMNRRVPVTHPKCPYLYAHRVTSLIGKGTGDAVRQPPTPPQLPSIGTKPVADYHKYKQYEVGIEFSSRPYPIISDADFTPSVSGSWFKKDGTSESFTYAPEWVRYTDYDYFPQNSSTIQGQQGSMSLFGVPSVANPPPFSSPPWMWLPDMLLKIRWFQVPYRYIISPNSYIAPTDNRNWRGRVNQNWFWNWPPGSLLYMSYSVQKYTPPTFDIGTYPSYTGTLGTGKILIGNLINYERLCDIELTFLYTNRYRSGTITTPTNGNYIPAGHNVLPNLADNKFYYATRNAVGGAADVNNPPPWFSFPLEALFSDPDSSGGPTTAGDN